MIVPQQRTALVVARVVRKPFNESFGVSVMKVKFPSAILIVILLLTSIILVSPIGNAEPATDDPISISGNADLQNQADLNDWLGDGTVANPYIIANLTIDAGGSGSAIAISGTDAYLVIENCTLNNSACGVEVTGAANVTIDHNTINTTYGVNITDSYNITVSNNHITITGNSAIALAGNAYANTISNNTINGTKEGICLLPGSSNNTVTLNTITLNTVTPYENVGIYLDHSNNNTISYNAVHYPVEWIDYGDMYGICLFISNDNTILNNTVTNSVGGIYLLESSNNAVSNNTVQNAWDKGILLIEVSDGGGSNNNVLANNTITGTSAGIETFGARANAITNNTITDTRDCAIHLQDSSNNTVSNNTIADSISAIYLSVSSNVTVTNNTIAGVGTGIIVEGWLDSDDEVGVSDGNDVSNNTIDTRYQGIVIYYSTNCTICNNIIGGEIETSYQETTDGIILGSTSAYLDGNELTNCSIVLAFEELGYDIDVQTYIDGMTITSTNTVNNDPVYFRKNVNMNNASVPSSVGEVILLNVTYLNVNELDLNHAGVIVGFSSHISIGSNTINNASAGVILFTSDYCTVSDNVITDSRWLGVGIDRSNNNTIAGNIISQAGRVGITVGSVYAGGPGSATRIIGGDSIPARESSNNTISNNGINGTRLAGIYLMRYSVNDTVANNTITDSRYGILTRGIGNIIRNNTVGDLEGSGIEMGYDAYDNQVVNNMISGAEEGIVLDGGSHNTIMGNWINGSFGNGIILTNNDGTNIVYANVLIGNNGATATYDAEHAQAYDDSNNQWNNGTIGNYWSDWQTPDADHDGIVDVPYPLAGDADGQDTLPMVMMYVYVSSPVSPVHTNLSTIYVTGIASARSPYEVSWMNEATGASGVSTGTAAWSANIGLAEGSNQIIVTVTDPIGNHTSTYMMVIYDPVAPVITAHTPIGDAVAVDVAPSVTFSEPMNLSSVSIQIDGMAGAVSWDGDVATFTPSSSFAYATTYAVIVSGQDLAGNAVSCEWTFTTMKNEGVIEGVIKDVAGNAIAHATVTLSNGMTTTTDVNGHFVFDNVTAGTYDLTISKDGYATITRSVSTYAGQTSDLGSLSVLAASGNSSSNDLLIAGAAFVVIVALLAAAFLLFRRKRTA
jgi:parallel beta-helix repeat protein